MRIFPSPKRMIAEAMSASVDNAMSAAPDAIQGRLARLADTEPGQLLSRNAERILARLPDFGQVVLLCLSGTSAIAAGFLIGIGLDFIALVDKWSIVGTVVFYFSIVLALMSPLLAIPHTIRSWVKAESDRQQQRAIAAAHEAARLGKYNLMDREQVELTIKEYSTALADARQEQVKRSEELVDARSRLADLSVKQPIDDRSILGKAINKDPKILHQEHIQTWKVREQTLSGQITDLVGTIEGAVNTLAKLEERKADLERSAAVIGRKEKRSRLHESFARKLRWLLAIPYAAYVALGALLLINLVSPVWTIGLVGVLIVLALLVRFTGLAFTSPWIVAALVILGYAVGTHAYRLEANVNLYVQNQPNAKVRILLATQDGVIVVKQPACRRFAQPSDPCDLKKLCIDPPSAKRELAFIPRASLVNATMDEPVAPAEWISSLKPFCWLRP